MVKRIKLILSKTWFFFASKGMEFWLIPIAGSIVTGWAVDAAKVFVASQPFSIVAAMILAFVLLAFGLACYGAYQNWCSAASLRNRINQPVSAINPLKESFTRDRIAITDLIDPVRRTILRKTFTKCEIVGPALVLIKGGTIVSGPEFQMNVGSDIIALGDIPEGSIVHRSQNVILADSCNFIDCSFVSMVLLMSDHDANQLGISAGGNTLVTPKTEDNGNGKIPKS